MQGFAADAQQDLASIDAAEWTRDGITAWDFGDLPEQIEVQRKGLTLLGYQLIFIHAIILIVGAHYTYSAVPYEQWLQVLSGVSLQDAFGLGRNHYDRLMHLLYGLLVTPAAMELLQARTSPRGGWRWLLPVAFMGLHSVVYELVEWGAALAFGGELGAAYLGTHGDIWDAQQDMALALLGSVVAVTAVLWRDARRSASSPDPLAAASAPAGGNT